MASPLPGGMAGGAPDRGWEPPPSPREGVLRRYVSAVRRYAWLVVLFALVGAGGGYVASTYIEPEYEVRATILLARGSGDGGAQRGPIQAEEFLATAGFRDLLRSYQVADPVVNDLRLFLTPDKAADSTLFRTFRVEQGRLRPGEYVLALAGGRYTLALKRGIQVEQGLIGDSVGRAVGFAWQPPAQALAGRASVAFTVVTPREASNTLIEKLRIPETDQAFLKMSLSGTDPIRTAATLNAWVRQFEAVSTSLKKKKVSQAARILEGQREYAAQQVSEAEAALQRFRVQTVTEPSEKQAIVPGLDMTNSPVFDTYFREKITAEAFRRDREALEAIARGAGDNGGITREAVLSIPSVSADPAAEDLRKVLQEQADRDAALRRLRETFQDEYPVVKQEAAALATLRGTTVPRALAAYAEQLRRREQALNASISQKGADLRAIPVRTIEEQRLKRQLEVANQTYLSLNMRAVEAAMADASTVPDVQVLDEAVAPLKPTRNTAPVIILGAIAAAIGVAVLLAILLDRLDRRFRYTEQVTDELGLYIMGVMPVIAADGRNSADQASQVVEAFRTIRMNVRYAALPNRPLTVTITSPGPNDGKSLIASNLALSFAESGARTLLVDGDIRRGELGETFGTPSEPGLVDYLDGRALLGEVLLATASHPNLTLLPAGARRRRAPELLATPRLPQLLAQMGRDFDVVIVDSPPLGAGFDAFALATATGNMLLVMRPGTTDRKMAAAKLAQMDTLPVRVMGAVVNGITLTGEYEYYAYYREYQPSEDEVEEEPEEAPRLAPGARVATTLGMALALAVAAGGAPAAAQSSMALPPAGAQRATRDELTNRVAALEAQVARGGGGAVRARADLAATRARLEQGDFKVGDRFVLTYRLERVGVDTVAVRDSLKVSLGGLPDARLGGVLRSELDAHLERHVARYLRSYSVRASVLTRIAVFGAVRNPGYYYVPPDRPLSDLVMVAGGPAPESRPTELEVRRGGQPLLRGKDSRRAIKDGRTLEELDIQSGDEVEVPARRRVNYGLIVQSALVASSLVFAGLQFLQWYYSRQQ